MNISIFQSKTFPHLTTLEAFRTEHIHFSLYICQMHALWLFRNRISL